MTSPVSVSATKKPASFEKLPVALKLPALENVVVTVAMPDASVVAGETGVAVPVKLNVTVSPAIGSFDGIARSVAETCSVSPATPLASSTTSCVL